MRGHEKENIVMHLRDLFFLSSIALAKRVSTKSLLTSTNSGCIENSYADSIKIPTRVHQSALK